MIPRPRTLTAAEYVDLRRAIEADYVAARVVIRPDGWLISETEHRLFGDAPSRDGETEPSLPAVPAPTLGRGKTG